MDSVLGSGSQKSGKHASWPFEKMLVRNWPERLCKLTTPKKEWSIRHTFLALDKIQATKITAAAAAVHS